MATKRQMDVQGYQLAFLKSRNHSLQQQQQQQQVGAMGEARTSIFTEDLISNILQSVMHLQI